MLEAAQRGDIRLGASRLLEAEVGRFRGDTSGPAVDQLVLDFLTHANVQRSEVDLLVAREARRLSWTCQLKSAADSVHLATAKLRDATVFISRDGVFPTHR